MYQGALARAWDTVEEIATTEWNAAIGVPLTTAPREVKVNWLSHIERGMAITFSDLRKSRVSSRSISLTPGLSTMDDIGRLWRESVQRQLPWESAK